MIKDRLKNLDLILLVSLGGLLLLGLLAVYSTSQSLPQSGTASGFFVSQIRWILLGIGVLIAVAFMPNRLIYDLSYPGYVISLIFLVLVLFVGTTGYGATRWLRIGSVGFQPSEVAKVATLMAVARYLSDERLNINQLKVFLIATMLILIPFFLIVRQPDLGTALVFITIILPIFFWSGLSAGHVLMIIIPGLALLASFNYFSFLAVMLLVVGILIYQRPAVLFSVFYFIGNVAVGLITPLAWNQLQDYQKQRILTFWNPEADPLGAGYQIIQSKVAIGSGGFLGKGFMQGSQTQLRFLPEQHTDFIFAVIGEEFGFLGVMAGLILFAVFLCRIVQVASLFRSRFSSIIAIGIATIIGFHMFVNIGMTIGLFPVTGLPLPFISYGGTSLLINLIMVGMLLNFYRHRFEY